MRTEPARFEALDERFRGVDGDSRRRCCSAAAGGWKSRCTCQPDGTCCSATSPTTACCGGTRRRAWSATSAGPRATPTAARSTAPGRLVTCEQGRRRVTRTEHDGTSTVLADRYDGKRLNSPNDVVERADGSIWFTDPSYGIDSDYEGHRAASEIGGCHVYRIDPAGGVSAIVADDFDRPNGLAFSLDERRLYVVRQPPKPHPPFDVTDEGGLSGGDVFADCDAGAFDGLRLDADGRVWAAAHDGLHCFDPDGTLLGKLLVPEVVANLAFGGPAQPAVHDGDDEPVLAARQVQRRRLPRPIGAPLGRRATSSRSMASPSLVGRRTSCSRSISRPAGCRRELVLGVEQPRVPGAAHPVGEVAPGVADDHQRAGGRQPGSDPPEDIVDDVEVNHEHQVVVDADLRLPGTHVVDDPRDGDGPGLRPPACDGDTGEVDRRDLPPKPANHAA